MTEKKTMTFLSDDEMSAENAVGIRLQKDEFEKLVAEAMDSLPEEFREKLENVDIVVEDRPSEYIRRTINASDKCLVLGLYQGVPLSDRTHQYGLVMPDKISIFKDHIERICNTRQDIVKTVVHTVQHELAHHFGISDDRLRELGIY